eukprot:TRINITY_DN19766_c0_g1_i1.p1 TRINITY_DN19766_c0_g1~~TRINITY_DN19766_c0_g1_i1.p1  ORF type:complete len:199 (-),score=24.53 TRINITY_DN19766_c0_g1_i1:620-1216(-)
MSTAMEQLRETMFMAADRAKSAAERAKGAMGGAVDKAREMVGLAEESPPVVPEEPSMMDELSQSCALTYKQRLYGFAGCLALGFFCVFLSMLVFFHPVKFAVTYTTGNLLAMASTGFLIGFWRQLQLMFDKVRAVAAIIYLVAIFLTLFCALWMHDSLLTLSCIVVQFSALLWYSLSYIPFAQAAAKKIFRTCYESEF